MPAPASPEPNGLPERAVVHVPPKILSLAATRAKPAVLGTNPTLIGLLQALRRRWLLAFSLGVLAAAAVVGGLYFFAKTTYTSRSLLHVASSRPIVLENVDRGADFGNYQRNQIALIKSRLVINSALREPKVASLPVVQAKVDPVVWLEREIMVDFNIAPEIMRIAMTGEDPEEIRVLVDAVRAAYLREIVYKENNQRVDRLAKLKKLHAGYDQRLQHRIDVFKALALAEDAGPADPNAAALLNKLEIGIIHKIESDILSVQSDLWKAKIQLKLATTKGTAEIPPVPDSVIEDALRNKAELKTYFDTMKILEGEIENVNVFRRDLLDHPSHKKNLEALKMKKKEVAILVEKSRPQVAKEIQALLNAQARAGAELHKNHVQLLEEWEAVLIKEFKGRTEDLVKARKNQINLDEKRDQIAMDKGIVKKFNDQIIALEIEQDAPERVIVLEEAFTIKDTDSRIRQMGMAGGSVFVVIVFGVALLEFRKRRVNTVDEVVRGLDLRLMGTLPALPSWARRSMGGGGSAREMYWESLLTESVDAARTMLLHAARAESHQVVMVCSAVGGEGKTMLSCHLAVSLARAGFRTLLVDCDLRRPSVHKLFGLDSSPGYSEVLRGELDAVEAAQPGPLEGLWIVPAGYADSATYQALAQHRSKEIFKELKTQFDFILVDSAPVLPVADSLLIAQSVDSVVISILRDVSRLPTVYAAYECLAALRVPILGAVVNGTAGDHYNTRYSYGYSGRTAPVLEPSVDEAGIGSGTGV